MSSDDIERLRFAERQINDVEAAFASGDLAEVVRLAGYALGAVVAVDPHDTWPELVTARLAVARLRAAVDAVLLDDDLAARRLEVFIAITGPLRHRVIETLDDLLATSAMEAGVG